MNLIVFPIRYISLMSYQYRTLNTQEDSRLKLSIGRTVSLINLIILLIENRAVHIIGIYLVGIFLFEVSRGGLGLMVLTYTFI